MVRVRFAPSPTGFLHVGNARTALFNWLFARHNNGRFILRIEDTDIERSKEDYTNQIFSDLKWLGLQWDEGPDIEGEFGPYVQSKRLPSYEEFAQKLLSEGKAYHCFCSEEELKERRQEAIAKSLAPGYDNRCRNLTKADVEKFRSENRSSVIRFKVPHEELKVMDLIRGEVIFDTSLISDFVIMKSNGGPSFNFAVCVDDCLMKISHVIRGEDHLSNTPKHILLIRAMGFNLPQYAHMSLTLGPGGMKLSKRTLDTSILQYRELGYLPDGLVNYMTLLGWSSPSGREILSRDELIKEFSIEGMVRHQSIFDPEKLDWISGHYIRNAGIHEIAKIAIGYLKKDKLIGEVFDYGYIEKIVSTIRDHLSCISQISDQAKTFLIEKIEFDNEAKEFLNNGSFKKTLQTFLDEIQKVEEIDKDNFKDIFNKVKDILHIKGEALYKPIRIALTGSIHGPELNLVMPALGKERCLRRLRDAVGVLN